MLGYDTAEAEDNKSLGATGSFNAAVSSAGQHMSFAQLLKGAKAKKQHEDAKLDFAAIVIQVRPRVMSAKHGRE